jgi:hypothetical protein
MRSSIRRCDRMIACAGFVHSRVGARGAAQVCTGLRVRGRRGEEAAAAWLPAPRAREERAAPGRSGESRIVPRRATCGGPRWLRIAGIRGARFPALPRLWRRRSRLLEARLRELWPGDGGRLFMQGPWVLSVLSWARPHWDRPRGAGHEERRPVRQQCGHPSRSGRQGAARSGRDRPPAFSEAPLCYYESPLGRGALRRRGAECLVFVSRSGELYKSQ